MAGLRWRLRAVEALWRELVVPPRAEQLRHEQVRQHGRLEGRQGVEKKEAAWGRESVLGGSRLVSADLDLGYSRRLPLAHVARHHRHRVPARLGRAAASQRHHRVRVLLHREGTHPPPRRSGRAQRRGDEGPSPRPDDLGVGVRVGVRGRGRGRGRGSGSGLNEVAYHHDGGLSARLVPLAEVEVDRPLVPLVLDRVL